MGPALSCLAAVAVFLLLVRFAAFAARRFAGRRRRAAFNALPGFGVSLPLVGDLPHLVAPGRLLANGLAMFARFGPTWRLWLGPLPVVVLSRPEDYEVVMGKFIGKPRHLYGTVETFFGTGLATLNGSVWRGHRKHLTPAFHFRILEQYVGVFERKAVALADRLQARVNGDGFNVFPPFAFATNDTIFETAFGLDESANRAVDPERRQAFVNAMEDAFLVMQTRVLKPWLLLDWVFNLTDDGRRFKEADRMIDEFAGRVILDKKQHRDRAAGNSFLDLMMKADDDQVLSDAEIRGELRTFISVQQTSATIMSFVMVMLALHPQVQQRVVAEAVEELGAEGGVSFSSLTGLKFLERVLKETMRLYPVLPVFARDVTEDVVLTDGTVPAGCCVAVAAVYTHRDPALWEHAGRFDPDRFLPERCAGRHPYSYLPFSAGPRNCIGQKYAMLQMKAVLATLLRRFEVAPAKGCATMAEVEAQTDVNIFLTLPKGFNIRLLPVQSVYDDAVIMLSPPMKRNPRVREEPCQ
ncbi:cytochrome P450 4C1-like [Thrips palmi]|uniref:Cytochrome P450 4C1-like n=1 Tax=Thrips palmi TaxID=161013 RepID=A0A6P8YWQ3_THRPL|nr:cytochrome P450 4C1-like [Thrips palmi]